MKNFYAIRAWGISILIGSIISLVPATGFAERVLYAINNQDPILHIVNPLTGAEISSVAISVAGDTIANSTGLAISPVSNEMYAAVALTSQNRPSRSIVKIDRGTGVATIIGHTGQPIASLAFDDSGVLYAIIGDCKQGCGAGINPESLFTVDLNDGSLTFVQTLGNGDDGEAIGFNPVDRMMYHMSGRGNGLIFEKINLSSGVVTPISLSGDSVTNPDLEAIGFTWDSGQGLFIGSLIDCGCEGTERQYVSITAGGVVTHVNPLPVWWKDYAFLDVGGGGGVLLDLEAMSDVDESGAVDLAVLVADLPAEAQALSAVAPGSKVYVKDGATGNPISEMTVFDQSWQAIDLAVTPGGANSLIGVLAQKDDDLVSVAVHRADDGSFVREIPFFGRKWVPSALTYVANADGPGGSAFAVVAKHRDDNRVSVQLRRRSDGSLINTTTYFRNNWEAIDLETMADISGNARPEVILLGQSDIGQIVVFVKDASTKAVVNKISYLGKTTTPKAITVIDDIGESMAPELPVLGERPDGRNIVQNRDAMTDIRVNNVFFLNSRWDSIDVGGLDDVNGNTSADLAVLAQHVSTNAIKSEVRDASTGDLIKAVNFLGASWDARAFAVFEDINGNGVQELGVVAVQDDGDIRVQIRDASSGSVIKTIDIP